MNFWPRLFFFIYLKNSATRKEVTMKDIKRRFTEWYIRKGYRFYYKVRFNGDIPEARWISPWYIKPLLILFSPTVYFYKMYGNMIVENFMKGMEEARRG